MLALRLDHHERPALRTQLLADTPADTAIAHQHHVILQVHRGRHVLHVCRFGVTRFVAIQQGEQQGEMLKQSPNEASDGSTS